jgi:hypothetical protein
MVEGERRSAVPDVIYDGQRAFSKFSHQKRNFWNPSPKELKTNLK